MSERTRDFTQPSAPSPGDAPPPGGAAAFPGATAVTVLDVYDWVAPDGLPGGSAHVHLASTEGYVVIGGEGRLQTLGQRGYAETPLRPGDCLWFTPGTIHRLVNDGQLRLLVVMQNAGLPEHGDAVLTFPPEILADPLAYSRAASLTSTDASEPDAGAGAAVAGAAVAGAAVAGAAVAGAAAEESAGEGGRGEPEGARDGAGPGFLTGGADGVPALAAAARRRASLAVQGYLALRERVAARGPAALEEFYAAALRLTGERTGDWLGRWRSGALATAELTGTHLAEVGAQVAGHLELASLWRIERPTAARGYGMCGRLTTYPAAQAVRAG